MFCVHFYYSTSRDGIGRRDAQLTTHLVSLIINIIIIFRTPSDRSALYSILYYTVLLLCGIHKHTYKKHNIITYKWYYNVPPVRVSTITVGSQHEFRLYLIYLNSWYTLFTVNRYFIRLITRKAAISR